MDGHDVVNHPNRSHIPLLRQARQTILDNSTALIYADLTGDARRLADAQLERNSSLADAIGQALAKEPAL